MATLVFMAVRIERLQLPEKYQSVFKIGTIKDVKRLRFNKIEFKKRKDCFVIMFEIFKK